MPGSTSSPHDFNFDDDFRRPRRAAAAASRSKFIESGTDDEDAGGSKRKKKITKTTPAKRARHQRDSSDSDEEKDADMRNLTEKERELQIFKHMEHQELLKTRKEIQQKLMIDAVEEKSKPKKRKEEPKPAPPPPVTIKSDKESGEESSSSDDHVPKTKSPTPQSRTNAEESEKEEDSDESEYEFDTEYHKPSEIAKKMGKKNAIAELVKSRKEKKHNEEKKREQVLDVDKIFGGSKTKEEKSDSDDSSSSDSSASDSEESDNDADNNLKPQGEEVNRYEQLNEIRLSRHKLAKLCHTPFFDKTVLGCFVRIGVGQVNGLQVYRAAQVVAVVESAMVYNVDSTRTNKALRLKHGPDERVWRLEFISNSEITNNEYLKWRDAMKKAKLPLPTTDFIQKKRNDIISALNYNFTDEDVKKMVQQRQKFDSGPKNHAIQKAKLLAMKKILSFFEFFFAFGKVFQPRKNVTKLSERHDKSNPLLAYAFAGKSVLAFFGATL
uniref:Plus3 domain-containing protein n=1 Tax=Panagrolaimus sp. PS1159 TaxID=55785 RepID=A0AC35GD79_9BILA